MRVPVLASLVLLASALAATPCRAAAGTDIGGVWLFRIEGGRGAVCLNFGVPVASTFTVRGLGVSLPHRAYFTVDDDAPATLRFLSTGRVVGTLPLEDLTQADDVGTLEVTHGKLGPLNRVATLHGTLTVDGVARRVVLHGLRRPSAVPDRSGGSHDGRVTGAGIASTRLFVDLARSDRHEALGLPATSENLGHPFYALTCDGPVRLAGTEIPSFTVTGLLVTDQQDELWGRVETSQFGPATLTGRFTFTDPTAPGRPVLHAHVTPDTGRRFNVRALL
jgi:hypothetical protein